MRRVMYNVCSTVQCTLSARICQDQVYFMPPCHATFTLAFWIIQNRKMFRLLIFRMTVLLAQSLLSVVKLISINRIWSLVIGPGFYSANKIWFCKNSWNLNTELQTWDTGGSGQRGGNLDSVEIWWDISQNQWPRKSFVKLHPRMTPLRPPSVWVLWMWQKASGNILQCVWFHLSECCWVCLVTAVV